MKFLYLLVFVVVGSNLLYAQEGDVPLNHFEIPISRQDFIFNDLKTDEQGRLLVAYQKGLLQFDGNSWLKIDISSTPLKFLEIGGRSFLLAKDGIYEISQDSFYQNTLGLVLPISVVSPTVDLLFHKNQYFLLINEEIRVFDRTFSEINNYRSQIGYKDIFTFQNKLYAFEDNYLLENIDGVWVDLNLYAPQDTDFVFSITGAKTLYFAYDNGDFYMFNGSTFDPYSASVNNYLKQNYPVSGKYFNQKLIISTLSGGVLIINENTGKILSTIQNYNGLPTNEVTALTMDYQNGLWLAHPYGLSRASLNIPLSDFQYYPGLEGLPQSTLMKNDTFWVASTEGLFFLKEVKNYETLQKKMIQKVRMSSPRGTSIETAEEQDNFLENIFSFGKDNEKEEFIKEELQKFRSIYRKDGIRFLALRKRLDEKEQQLRDSIEAKAKKVSKNLVKSSESRYRSVVKTFNISRLKSIDFEYQKISGLNHQIESILDTKYGLIAKSSRGIFLIKSGKAERISNLRSVEKLLYQEGSKILWLTNEQGLISIDLSLLAYPTRQHSQEVFYDLLIKNNILIAVGDDILEFFRIQGKQLTSLKKQLISNKFSEKPALYQEDDKVKLIRSDAILNLDLNSYKVSTDSLFSSPLKYFLKDQRGEIWLLSAGDIWSTISGEFSRKAIKWLHIIPSLQHVNIVNDSTAFFTTDERVIRWASTKKEDYPLPQTFIDGVMVENMWLTNDDLLKLQHGQNNLKVVLSTPEYLFKDEIQYQYFVKGLMDEWSTWSKIREIDFPYIPTGKYTLEIRAKSIFDDEISSFKLEFKILPPYWQTWWFYALELAFFSILILISIRLNTSNHSSYLTKTFTFLTLILFLEFLATILENNLEGYVDESPVYTFIINVILALSISPIEKGVTNLLLTLNSARSKKLISKMRKNQLNKKDE
jgi:hypothetical protein